MTGLILSLLLGPAPDRLQKANAPLVSQLASDDYQTRERAGRRLLEVPWGERLSRKLLSHPDPEVRKRAAEALSQFYQRRLASLPANDADYPCLDALWFDTTCHSYVSNICAFPWGGVCHEKYNPLLTEAKKTDSGWAWDNDWLAYRTGSHWLCESLAADGCPAVLIRLLLWEMRRRDAVFFGKR